MTDDVERQRTKAVENERLKLRATALNSVAASGFVTGAVAPILAGLYTSSITVSEWTICTVSAFVAFGALVVHLMAFAILGKLT